jgi:hypothetical protein
VKGLLISNLKYLYNDKNTVNYEKRWNYYMLFSNEISKWPIKIQYLAIPINKLGNEN